MAAGESPWLPAVRNKQQDRKYHVDTNAGSLLFTDRRTVEAKFWYAIISTYVHIVSTGLTSTTERR